MILQCLRGHPTDRQRWPFAIAVRRLCRLAAVVVLVERAPMKIEAKPIRRLGAALLAQYFGASRLQMQRSIQINGHAEIADFAHAIVVEQHVAGGQVTMNDLCK